MIIKSAMKYFHNILYVISFVFILFLSLYAYDNSVNMLWADEWDTPGNLIYKEINDPINVSIYDFTSQHNESRKIIPKIIYYTAYIAGLFDTRIGVLIRILLSILSVMVISHICNTNDGKDSVKYLLATLCIFIPTQAYNQIFGLQFITIVPSFCLIIILLINKNIKSLTTGLFLSIIFCIISTFTYSNGLIIWALSNPLVFKLLGVRNFKLYHILSFNFVFLLTLIFYFYDYQHPSHHPGMLKGILNPLRTIEYFTLWLWSPFVIHLPHPKYLCFILTISYFFLLIYLLFHIKILYIPTRKVCFSILCPVILLFYGIFFWLYCFFRKKRFRCKSRIRSAIPFFCIVGTSRFDPFIL